MSTDGEVNCCLEDAVEKATRLNPNDGNNESNTSTQVAHKADLSTVQIKKTGEEEPSKVTPSELGKKRKKPAETYPDQSNSDSGNGETSWKKVSTAEERRVEVEDRKVETPNVRAKNKSKNESEWTLQTIKLDPNTQTNQKFVQSWTSSNPDRAVKVKLITGEWKLISVENNDVSLEKPMTAWVYYQAPKRRGRPQLPSHLHVSARTRWDRYEAKRLKHRMDVLSNQVAFVRAAVECKARLPTEFVLLNRGGSRVSVAFVRQTKAQDQVLSEFVARAGNAFGTVYVRQKQLVKRECPKLHGDQQESEGSQTDTKGSNKGVKEKQHGFPLETEVEEVKALIEDGCMYSVGQDYGTPATQGSSSSTINVTKNEPDTGQQPILAPPVPVQYIPVPYVPQGYHQHFPFMHHPMYSTFPMPPQAMPPQPMYPQQFPLVPPQHQMLQQQPPQPPQVMLAPPPQPYPQTQEFMYLPQNQDQ